MGSNLMPFIAKNVERFLSKSHTGPYISPVGTQARPGLQRSGGETAFDSDRNCTLKSETKLPRRGSCTLLAIEMNGILFEQEIARVWTGPWVSVVSFENEFLHSTCGSGG